MKKTILLFICILPFIGMSGQSDFREGYYITNQNDTINGYIDFRGEHRNSKVCSFKKNPDAEAQKFEPGEIKAYRFKDGKYYISKTINLQNGEELPIFLEYLVNGMAKLYYYNDLEKDNYLIEMENGSLYRLTDDEKLVYIEGKGNVIKKTYKHIGLLKAAMATYPELNKQIESSELTHKSMIKIVKTYHDYACSGEKCIIYEKELVPVKFSFGLILGINFEYLVFSHNTLYSKFGYSNTQSPNFGIILNTKLPRTGYGISFDLATSFSKSNFSHYHEAEGVAYNTFHTYSMQTNISSLNTSFGLKYVLPERKFRFGTGLGISLKTNFNKNSHLVHFTDQNGLYYEDITDTELLRKTMLGGYFLAAGEVHFSSNIAFIHLIYQINVSQTVEVTSKINSFGMTLGFLF